MKKKSKGGMPPRRMVDLLQEEALPNVQKLVKDHSDAEHPANGAKAVNPEVNDAAKAPMKMKEKSVKQKDRGASMPARMLPTKGKQRLTSPPDMLSELDPKRITPVASPKALPTEVNKISQDVKDCSYYPLDKAKARKEEILKRTKPMIEDFSGMTQLTDFAIFTMMTTSDKAKCSTVRSANLSGCINMTDIGLLWFADMCPNIEAIKLTGCQKITEMGLHGLTIRCKNLKTVDLVGTNVAILPNAVKDMNVSLGGYPVVSPEAKVLKQQGLAIMSASSYAKPANSDIVKLCVVQGSECQHSFVKYVKGQKDATRAILDTCNKTKINDRFTVNMIECDESIVDLLITKRTLYLFTVVSGDDAKKRAGEIFAHMCQIINKVPKAVFGLVAMQKGDEKVPIDTVKAEIGAMTKMTSVSLKKTIEENINKSLGTTKGSSSFGDSIEAQNRLRSKVVLSVALDKLEMVTMKLDISKPCKITEDLKPLVDGFENVCGLHPEFQEMAMPIHTLMMSDNIEKMFTGGVLSIDNTQSVTVKLMEFIETTGHALFFKILDEDGPVVCQIEWLSTVLNLAYKPTTANDGRLICLPGNCALWKYDDLQAALAKVLPKEQSQIAAQVSLRLGISCYPTLILPFTELPDQPEVPLESFFPEIPPFLKNTELFYTVGYRANFQMPVPRTVLRQLIFLCSKIRKWSIAWKTGFIIQEGNVETLIHWRDQVKGEGYSLSLFCHAVKTSSAKDLTMIIKECVWNSLLQFKLIMDYVISSNQLACDVGFVDGQGVEPKKGEMYAESRVSGLIYNHPYGYIETGEGTGQVICKICGSLPKVAAIPWLLNTSMCVTTPPEDSIDLTSNTTTIQGSLLTFKDSSVQLRSCNLNPNQNNVFRVQLMDERIKGLEIGIAHGALVKGAFNGGFFLDFEKNSLVKRKSDAEDQGIAIAPEKMPQAGDVVSFLVSPQDNQTTVELKIFRNYECISKCMVSNHTYTPYLAAKETTLMLHPLHYEKNQNSYNSCISAGMRLEAVDKQNPHLICVATVDQILPDGKLNIHFDGWTARYDYVCDITDPDLHPIGYMQYNSTKLGNRVNRELQIPKGYSKGVFHWAKYLEEESSLPVPYSYFSDGQIKDTPQSVEVEVMLALGVKLTYSCPVMRNRPKVFEYQTLNKCKMSKSVFEFFTDHSKYFCVLPRDMNIQLLQYPTLAALMNFSKQNIHLLCPGLKMDVLHFVDDTGAPLDKYETMLVPQNAQYLQYCIIGLLFQQSVLPKQCTKLIPGIDKVDNTALLDTMMQKLLFMYITNLEILVPKHQATESIVFSREALDIFKSTATDPKIAKLFSDGDRYLRCKGHALSSMANQDLKEISLNECGQLFAFMTRMDFQNNQIEKIPDDFFQELTALESLNLSKNQISKLPTGIGKLKELTDVDLSYNNITELPADFQDLKDTLVCLDVSHNPLKGFPKCIFQCTKLQDLIAENVGVIGDLAEIKNLKELKNLHLGYNCIEKIPEELGDLPLTHLNLSGVQWVPNTNYPTAVMFTKALNQSQVLKKLSIDEQKKLFNKADIDESSDLSKDEVVALNYNVLFHKYPRFGQKTLAYEATGGIPSMIFKLKNLKKLVLRYHGIKMVPDEIKALKELNDLDISHNPYLQSLSAELAALPLKQLHVEECVAMNTPPKEIVSRGFLAIIGYLKRLRLGASPCKRTKLMMVGLGGAGKTSLVQSLMNKRYRAYMDYDEPITDGIDINNWEVAVGDQDKVTYSVWDFAGQTVYYNTHQFFLSNRAVYLLLWNVRQGYEHAGLDFWLSSIACHAPKAPILVVGTHIDKVERYRLPEEALKARYPQISAFHYVSSFTGDGVQELRDMIIKLTLQQKYMGEKIPEAWLSLEKRLITHRQEKKVDILPFKTLEALGATCGVFDRNELIQAVQFLHDLGAVQFFDTDFLRSMVVIYPQWIVDVMACLVTVHQGAVKDGKMLLKDVTKVWGKYPAELHPWLLRLTEEFDLTCPLQEEEASIVPCLLPDTEPAYEWPHADPAKNKRESMMLYKFQYLPAGLFNRAQVRLHQYSNGAKLWKKGSYMKKNNHIAVMLQNDEQEVIVRVQGFRPENFLFIVHEMFETLIQESYAGVNYDFQIPCLDCLNMNVKDPSMMSYMKVKRALELNVPFIQCEKFFHISSIEELKVSANTVAFIRSLAERQIKATVFAETCKVSMPSDKMSNVDNHLQNSVSELKDLNQEALISAFFVYTSKNIPELKDAEKLVHPGTILEDLRKQDTFRISYTDKPESSDMEALTLSIKACSVVIIGLSDEFCDNAECKKLLLYVKNVLQKPVLLVLLGKTKNWQNGDLNMTFGTEVYVDMQNIGRYEHKILELYEAIKKKAASKKMVTADIPKCFISYCWSNSHDAISKGSKVKDGALGWDKGDPRLVKEFLEEKDIKCWIDIEKVGGVGLFHSIADGLKQAEVMVAFVSDHYVKSKNCVMEFRYGLTTLCIPVIVVVVGTGYEWERSEVGLLSVGHKCPKINFQFGNEAGYLELLKLVQDSLKDSKGPSETQHFENQRTVAFQEVLELTQRKFLRHINTTFLSSDLEPYPSLVVVDFVTDKEKHDWQIQHRKRLKGRESSKQDTEEKGGADKDAKDGKAVEKDEKQCPSQGQEEDLEDINDGAKLKSKYCYRFLCEDNNGWHVMPKVIHFPELDQEEEQRVVEAAAPFLSRVYGISKHAHIQLECITTPEGEMFQQRLEEIAVKSSGDFKQEYLDLRSNVMQLDKMRTMGHLNRCQVNGKMLWLCDKHKKASRSMTEQRYGDKLTTKEEEIPISDMPESYAQVDDVMPETTASENKPRKMFRKHMSGKPNLQRQTSQMCSVM